MDEEVNQFRMTHNVLNRTDFLGIPKRQWIEGIILLIVFSLIVSAIPFTPIVRRVVIIVYGGSLCALGIHGIKRLSISEIIIGEIKFLKGRKILHLCGPEYKRQKNMTAGGQYRESSDLERIIENVKKRIQDFTDEYADN